MAYFSFTKAILEDRPIQIYNNGNMYRDFTYIDDIVTGIIRILNHPPAADENGVSFKIYNMGNNRPEKLLDFIEILERNLGKKAIKEFLPMQPGDVLQTYADISDLVRDFDFKPDTSIETGLSRFVEWYKNTYHF
jgi:UDP-glucuronate 4-epimerase